MDIKFKVFVLRSLKFILYKIAHPDHVPSIKDDAVKLINQMEDYIHDMRMK